MTPVTPRKRIWLAVFLVLLTLGSSAGAFLYYNPLWVMDRSVDVYLRGNGIQHRWTEVDGRKIHYLEANAGKSTGERPLLLIHGLGAKASDWAPVLPELTSHGYHIYAIDLLGYGDSEKPADGDYSLKGEERVVVDFMKQLNIPSADVAGWSMGGWVASKVALDRPDLVNRLLLYDSAGMYYAIDFPLSLFSPHDRQGLEALTERIEPNTPHIRIPAFAVPGMLRRFQASQHIVDSSFQSMLEGRDILDFRIHRLRMPVLLIWGTEDKLTPYSLAERLHEQVPQSVLVGIRGCGHLAAAECSKQVLPATEQFLDSKPPQRGYEQVLDSGWPTRTTPLDVLASRL